MATMEYTVQYPCGLTRHDIVGMGITSLVAHLDAVIKFAIPGQQHMIDREKRIYQRLGYDHNGVVRYFGTLEGGIVLQYARYGSIRQYLLKQAEPLPLSLQLRWVKQIADTVAFVHSKNILHGDISCNNIFLAEDLDTKLGDFAGSAIDEEPPLACYETSHEHPSFEGISVQSEIFALGSSIYEIMTGLSPYKGLSDPEICEAFGQEKYPALDSLAAFSNIIAKSWARGYTSTNEFVADIDAEVTSKSKRQLQPKVWPTALYHMAIMPAAVTTMIVLPIVLWARRRR